MSMGDIRDTSFPRFDVTTFIATLLLTVIGIMFIYSSGTTTSGVVFSSEYIRQIVWFATGLLLMFGVYFLDYRRLSDIAPYFFVAILILLALTLRFGRVVNGARRWIGIGNLGFQPSEFAKIAVILLLARYLDRSRGAITRLHRFIMAFSILVLPVLLVVVQPDLGTAMVFLPIFFFMTYAAGARLRHIFFVLATGLLLVMFSVLPAYESLILRRSVPIISVLRDTTLVSIVLAGTGAALLLSVVGWFVTKRKPFFWTVFVLSIFLLALGGSYVLRNFLREYQIMRFIVFIDPEIDPRGTGWNTIQSITAVGSGGLSGKGFLRGTQGQYRYLPQQSTDFIFSVLSEEWGFIGSVVVILLFIVVFARGFSIVLHARDAFGAYVASGIIGMLFFHAAVNIGMAIGVMPITGLPLFFVSFGGSSLWTGFLAIGILMSIHRRRIHL